MAAQKRGVKKERKATDTWKKKVWYTVISPKEFESKEVGTTPALKPEQVLNRIIRVSLRDVTGNIAHQAYTMLFKVKEVKGTTAHTETAGFEMVREHFRRNVRRGRSMITAIHDLKTKDGRKAQMTLHVFTLGRINTEKKDQIRKIAVQTIDEIAGEETLHGLVKKALYGELGAEVKKRAKALCPIRTAIVSKLEIQGV